MDNQDKAPQKNIAIIKRIDAFLVSSGPSKDALRHTLFVEPEESDWLVPVVDISSEMAEKIGSRF